MHIIRQRKIFFFAVTVILPCMGYSTHTVNHLGDPFLFLDEITFFVPEGGEVEITRDQFKFLFVLDGCLHHELDEWATPKVLKTGDILICPGFQRHLFSSPVPTTLARLHVLRLFMNTEVLRGTGKPDAEDDSDFTAFVREIFTEPVQLSGGMDSHISERVTEIRGETEQRKFGYKHRVQAQCVNLLVELARKLEGDGPEPSTPTFPRERSARSLLVTSAKEYILKNHPGKITLGQIAWHLGKGEEHLSRVFKHETGQTVFEFVRLVRVEHAKTLLQDGSKSLTDIAGETGFASLAFFSRTFKQVAGLAPSEYRKNLHTTLNAPPG